MFSTKKLKRYSKEVRYFNFKSRNFILINLLFIILLGLLIGKIINNNMNLTQQSYFRNYIDNYFNNFRPEITMKSQLFIESVFKYCKGVIFIWVLGFINLGFIISLFILCTRFISLGLVTSFFISYYGVRGLWYIFVLYIPQNLILIPTYFLITYHSIRFKMKRNKSKINFWEYLLVLLISITLIVLVSLYETYIAPNLITYILK